MLYSLVELGGKATILAISLGKKLVVNTVGTKLVTSTFDGQGRSALSSIASATAVGKVVSAPMAEELVNRATSQSRSESLKSPLIQHRTAQLRGF